MTIPRLLPLGPEHRRAIREEAMAVIGQAAQSGVQEPRRGDLAWWATAALTYEQMLDDAAQLQPGALQGDGK